MEIKKFHLILGIYFALGLIVSGWGYSALLDGINSLFERYRFLLNLYLIGIFVGSITPLHKKSNKKFNFFSQLMLFGSLFALIFLGIQLIQFNLKATFIPSGFYEIIPHLSSISSAVMFTGLIGILVEFSKELYLKIKSPNF